MIPAVFFLLILIGGSNSSIVKYATNEFPPLIVVSLRAAIAFLFLTPFILKTVKITLNKKTLHLLSINILFAINWIAFVIGVHMTSVTLSQLMYVPTSLIVAGLSAILLGEKFTKTQIAGLAITTLGASILAFESLSTQNAAFGNPLGNLIIGFGVICWSIYLVLSKRISHIYSPLTIIFYNFLVAFIIASVLILASPTARNFNITLVSKAGFLSIFYVGIMSSAIYFYINQWFVKHTTAFMSSLQIYPLTIMASIFGIIFYGERLTIGLTASALLIMSGVFLSTSYQYINRKRHGKN